MGGAQQCRCDGRATYDGMRRGSNVDGAFVILLSTFNVCEWEGLDSIDALNAVLMTERAKKANVDSAVGRVCSLLLQRTFCRVVVSWQKAPC